MRWGREQILGIGLMVLLGGWVAMVGIKNNAALSPPANNLEQAAVGDEWLYECHQGSIPETLRIKVLSAQPTPDGRARRLVCRYSHSSYRSGLYRGGKAGVETTSRDYLFTQYPDGSMVWHGASGAGPSISLTTLVFLPVLRSPLSEGKAVAFPNYSIPTGRDGSALPGSFRYEITGVEGIRFERQRQAAYRVEVRQTLQGRHGLFTEKWTEWYAGYAFPVRREYTLNDRVNIPLPRFGFTLTLVEFIPGKR